MNKFSISDLSIEDVNCIMSGLLELPGKFTLTLINKIRGQLEEQGIRTAQPPAPDAPQGPLSDKVIN